MAINISDISLSTYSGKTKNFSAQTGDNAGSFCFSQDGTKVYIQGYTNIGVFQYTLSTPFDISTATYANKVYNISSSYTDKNEMYFSPDGTKLYTYYQSGNSIHQHTLSTAWDISTASYASKNYSAGFSSCKGMYFSPDGTKLYLTDNNNGYLNQYSLSTAWDISTISYIRQIQFSSYSLYTGPIFFNDNGLKIFFANGNLGSNSGIYQYSLSTAWDISTISDDSKKKTTYADTSSNIIMGYWFNQNTGGNFYISNNFGPVVYQYNTNIVTNNKPNFLPFFQQIYS